MYEKTYNLRNDYFYDSDIGHCFILNNKAGGIAAFTCVDEIDVKYFSLKKISYGNMGYARMRDTLLHNLIKGGHKDMVVDHINQNKLDNRRTNLRVVSKQLNAFNSNPERSTKSGHVGIRLLPSGKFNAYVMDGKRYVWSKTYVTIEEAITGRSNKIKEILDS